MIWTTKEREEEVKSIGMMQKMMQFLTGKAMNLYSGEIRKEEIKIRLFTDTLSVS